MNYVDAHFHLWDLQENYYPWLTDRIVPDHVAGDYSAIRKNYLIDDYLADIERTPVVKGVHIQAEHDHDDPVRETRWLQSVADRPGSKGFPHAIVAHAFLEREDAPEILEEHLQFSNMRGIRQVLPKDMCDNPVLGRNFGLLARYDLSFDLRVRHHEMGDAAKLAARHTDVRFVITHLGYPLSREREYMANWREGMKRLAVLDNVLVKLSGFGFIDPDWHTETIRPLIIETIDMFGPYRSMFASDFPVDSLSRDFAAYWQAYEIIAAAFSDDEREAMFHANAENFYRI